MEGISRYATMEDLWTHWKEGRVVDAEVGGKGRVPPVEWLEREFGSKSKRGFWRAGAGEAHVRIVSPSHHSLSGDPPSHPSSRSSSSPPRVPPSRRPRLTPSTSQLRQRWTTFSILPKAISAIMLKYHKSSSEAISHILAMTKTTTQQVAATRRKWASLKVVI